MTYSRRRHTASTREEIRLPIKKLLRSLRRRPFVRCIDGQRTRESQSAGKNILKREEKTWDRVRLLGIYRLSGAFNDAYHNFNCPDLFFYLSSLTWQSVRLAPRNIGVEPPV
ncbi:hypothetical protein C8J57DRAFT_1474366 [Mycena rebaudengoi]|nr:hypothetical protein C8J57DRAFT_1474366 [Mycena rebaudengoi]